MKQYLLTFTFLAISTVLNAQTSTEETLQTIETHEQAKEFIKDKYAFNSKIFVFNEAKHKTQLAKALFKLEKGNVKTEKSVNEKTIYKILEKSTNSYYRVAYIYLDGNKYSESSIYTLRETLIKKYENGTPFSALANQYSMDDGVNKGGDTGWITLGEMPLEFENAVFSEHHELDDIYTLDVPSKNAYYLVLQTHEPKEIAEIKVLKIIEPFE